jgi:hypothetical protein
MPRGGKRRGTPGKAYSNRTDMGLNYDMKSRATPAAGGVRAPMQQMPAYPEDTPMLLDPTQRPDEPLSAGLPSGPGPGPEILDPRINETRALRKYLPLIEPLLMREDTPESVVSLVKYIKGA